MKKKYTSFFICLMSISSYIHAFPGQMQAQLLCIKTFGDQQAPKKQQFITRKALKEFGIDNVHLIPIKLIRNDIQYFQQYSSFTWFGIWFNQEALKCSKCAQWLAYHEAAHYVLAHPFKTLLGTGLITGGSLLLSRHCAHQLTHSRILSFIISGAGTMLITLLLLPELVRRFELEATKLAAHKLCSLGKMAIVEDQIEHLKNLNSPESSLCLPSIPDQLGALQSILQAWQKQVKNPEK